MMTPILQFHNSEELLGRRHLRQSRILLPPTTRSRLPPGPADPQPRPGEYLDIPDEHLDMPVEQVDRESRSASKEDIVDG